MGLVTHMLAHVVPMDAEPLGATLLAVWLILSGTPRTPHGPFVGLFSLTRKFHF
jgi:hypothetical protein